MTVSRVLYVGESTTGATLTAGALERSLASAVVEPATFAPALLSTTRPADRAGTVVDGPEPDVFSSVNALGDSAASVDCLVVELGPDRLVGQRPFEPLASCPTPVVLRDDGSYGPAAARDHPAIDGYCRRRSRSGDGTGDPVVDHTLEALADELAWQCDALERSSEGATADPSAVRSGVASDQSLADLEAESADEGRRERPSFTLEDDSGTTRTITQLHEMAGRLVACRSEDELLELANRTAEDVLGFDASSVAVPRTRDGERKLVVVEHTSWLGDIELEHDLSSGLLGKTFRERRSFLVPDLATNDDAEPYDASYESAIGVPIGEFGVFQAISTENGAYDEHDLRLAELLATHVAETIRRIRVELQLRERQETVTALSAGVVELLGAETEADLFERTIETAERILELDVCYLAIVEDGMFVPKGRAVWPVREDLEPLPLSHGVMGECYARGESIAVADADTDERTREHNGSFRSALTTPVGEFGVLQAVSEEPDAYDGFDLELLELLGAHLEQALARFRVEAELRDRRQRLAGLHEGAVRVVSASDEAGLYRRALETAERVLELDTCVFLSADADAGTLVPRAYSETMPEGDVQPVSVEYGAVGEAYRRGEPLLIEDVRTSPIVEDDWDQYLSAVTVPIGAHGVFQAVSTQPAAFDDVDLELAELLCAHLTEAIARMRAESDLIAERDRLSALFENVPDPAVQYELSDGTPRVVAVNDRFEAVFGYDRETIVHADIDGYIVPDGYEDEARRLNEALLEGRSLRVITRRRTAAEIRDFLINVVPLTEGERGAEGYAIYTDITEQKRHERALKAKNERLDEFASIVSHDLRNPLSVAQGYLELTLDDGDAADGLGERSYLEEIDDALSRMDELIEQLLTLSRRGNVIADRERIALERVATEAWNAVETGSAILEVDGDRPLEADHARVCELLENLFRNAVEHGAGGETDTLTVTVGVTDDGFYVADDGVGIPSEDRDRIFESGYTTADTGTGLGLAIVEQVADAHGWAVATDDSDDGGARFEFTVGGYDGAVVTDCGDGEATTDRSER